ncbi:Guanine nucleotide exchange factor lte1 [Malassezia equina]|uniref:Guanine nucleotide exchange factor lte1 n=1 Tax=Malassezia equina TaxID=1381935 RepID=A0AAF0EJL2_9BASI|nr:Guanine nucleotide exchange factor lte1 [Malassezia equina]
MTEVSEEQRQQPIPMVSDTADQSSLSNDVSYEPTFGADALIRPYDQSRDSSVLRREPSSQYHVPRRSSELGGLGASKWEDSTPTQPITDEPPAADTQQQGPEAPTPAAAETQPQVLSDTRASHPSNITLTAQNPPISPYQDRTAPAPPLDFRSMPGLGPVLPQSKTLPYMSTTSGSDSAAPPVPDRPGPWEREPVTVIANSTDSPDVVLGSSNHPPGMTVVHMAPAGPSAKTGDSAVASPNLASWNAAAHATAQTKPAGTALKDRPVMNTSPLAEPPAQDSSGEVRIPAESYRLGWLESVPLYLGIFSSTLTPALDAPYVLDMASPIDFEVRPNGSAEESRSVTMTGIRRNMRLLSRTKHQVVAATAHRLVAEMTSGSSPGLMQDVFLGYRQYLGAGRLLELLLSRMEWAITKIGDANAFQVALSVLLHTQAALWHWLQYYFEHDFASDEPLMRRLVQWMADQDYRVQFWQYVSDPSAVVAPPALKEAPTAVMPEQDEELPNNDPSERMHALWALVQALVPAALLPQQEAQSETPPKPMLQKSRSLTRMLALTNSPTRSRKRHSRWPSVSGTSVLAAVGSIPAATGSSVSPRVPSSSYKSPTAATMSSPPIGETSIETTQQPLLERSRSLKSLRRMLRRGADAPGDASAEDNSPRAKLETSTVEDEADEDTRKQDAALQLLEQALSDTPRPDALPSPQQKDGPIQWIPSHTSSSWREAQRLSIMAAQSMQEKNPREPVSRIQQRDTFLLCQRSSTIARQLGTLERQLLACVKWHELAEPSWEQHTVQQEQWQREYQDYIVSRIRAASDTEETLTPPPKTQGVHMLIARFNRACAWVATHIVTTTDLSERVMIVNKFIRIAWHCFRQGNMETLCQIMFGLQSPWVARLQRTWSRVALWELRAFDALRRFTSPRNQFAFLRQSMVEALDANATAKHRFSSPSTASAPYVPFFGLFISDLSTVDGLASFVDSSLMPNMMPFYDDQELSQSWDVLVNVYRLRIKACIVREFITLQRHERSAPEQHMELPILVESLQLDTLSAAAIQSTSLALEP